MRTMKNQHLYLIPLFFIIILAQSAATSQPNKFSDCKPTSYLCGDGCNISYPFRTPDMPEYCGHPALEISCKDNTTDRPMLTIDISGENYRVKSLDYDKQIISLENSDFLDDKCPRTFTNTTFDLSLFNYTDYIINITLYFNCYPRTSSSLRNSSCPGSDGRPYFLYYSLPHDELPPLAELYKNCGSVVRLPMYDDDAGMLVRGRMDFLGVLQNGFDLSWMVGNGWCKGCQYSGGVCGRDPIAPGKPTCFCPDGSTTGGECGM